MNHKMRRFKQLLPYNEAKAILCKATSGTLSLTDTDGTPYGVPLSFVYDGEKNAIYFHSAAKGHKIECITNNPKCSFCVIAQDLIKPEEFTSYFKSVIVSGDIRIVNDTDETMRALLLLCAKYSPGIDSSAEIKRCINHVLMLRLDIKEITGKEAIELVRMSPTH